MEEWSDTKISVVNWLSQETGILANELTTDM